jgi:wyosine [tRNA(Phe)-imidazoG37] synthetase (radical SAM superfamily)
MNLKSLLQKTMPLVYGPIESRRFGPSLGINCLGREKLCSFDCPYCDLERSEITMSRIRKETRFPDRSKIVNEAREALREHGETCNAITLSGNGEPTLYPEFEELVTDLKQVRLELAPKAKLVVLSNGAHLDSKKVIGGMNNVDVRAIKLDAGSDKVLKAVNAPLVRRNLAQFLEGIKKLDDCVIQSMFVTGSTDNTGSADVDEWVELIGMIKPVGVHLMTINRPPNTKTVRPVDDDSLYSIAFKLKKRTQIEAQVFSGKI